MSYLEGKKILITGANGFIGGKLVERMVSEGYTVYPLVGPGDNTSTIKIKSKYIDLLDFEGLVTYFKKIKSEIVYHLGAYVNLTRDFKVGLDCVDVNIKGTFNVLEACQLAGVDRVFFFSTQEVYGEGKTPYKEDQNLQPPSPYAVSKLAGENFCAIYKALHNLDYTILRLSTAYGPGQADNRLIPTIIKNALSSSDVNLNSGKKKRDYIFIEDLVDCVLTSSKSSKSKCQIFNVGGGVSYSLKSLAEKIVKYSSRKSQINLNKFPDRVGEADNMLSDINKAKNILGWKPKHSLDKGLEKTIKFYREYYNEKG